MAKRTRPPRPACPTCGHPLVGGECIRLDLHWTVCPDCRSVVDYGRTCPCAAATTINRP